MLHKLNVSITQACENQVQIMQILAFTYIIGKKLFLNVLIYFILMNIRVDDNYTSLF